MDEQAIHVVQFTRQRRLIMCTILISYLTGLLTVAALPLALAQTQNSETEQGAMPNSIEMLQEEIRQKQEAPDITSVSVDTVQYSAGDFTQLFNHQPLHWIVEPEAEAQGVLIAFTSEEKRDAAYGVQSLADEEAVPPPEDTFPFIYDLPSFRGRAWVVRRNMANLGSFNGLTSSVFAGGRRGLILYDNFNFRHCSFAVSGCSGVVNLGRYPLFCSVGGTWDNQTSSVRLW